MTTFSREHLQGLPAKRRSDAILCFVNQVYQPVVAAATAGNVSHLVDLTFYFKSRQTGVRSHPPVYLVTPDDIVEGFKEKFPGCRVEYGERWEEVRPGVKEQRSGILVDWS